MRMLTVVGVLLLLVVFPAISWYYLTQGADWRRAGLKEMAIKRPIYLPEVRTTSGKIVGTGVYPGKFIIVSSYDGPDYHQITQGLVDQFDHRSDLILMNISNKPNDPGWLTVDCAESPCDVIHREVFYKDAGKNAALIDEDLNLRNTYDLGNEDDLKALIEQASILFPVEKRKKVELRRGEQQ